VIAYAGVGVDVVAAVLATGSGGRCVTTEARGKAEPEDERRGDRDPR
jgi:hypothetical protein